MLAAMGTEARLRIMRLLLAAHPEGMVAGPEPEPRVEPAAGPEPERSPEPEQGRRQQQGQEKVVIPLRNAEVKDD